MANQEAAAARDAAIVEARMEWALALAPTPLGPAERDVVRSRIAKRVEEAGTLRRIPLANHDEPEIVYAPYRSIDRTGEGDDR